MLKTFLTKAVFVCAFTSALAATASANIVLDLDLNEGNQGVTSKQVQPGDIVEIELIAQQGALDIAGFEVAIKFDPQQFIFQGYQKGGLMAAAISLPAAPTADGAKISAGFLGGKSTSDSGSLGTLVFEVTQNLGAGGPIKLTQGSFGAAGKTEQFDLNSEVFLQGTSDTQTSGFQNQQDPPPHGRPDGHESSKPDGRPDGHESSKPDGRPGGHESSKPDGRPDGHESPKSMDDNMGMNHQGPIELIKSLPTHLQGMYFETMRMRLRGKLDELNHIRQTLETTNQYLMTANEQEKRAIGNVLRGFAREMRHGGPGDMNQGGPRSMGRGGPRGRGQGGPGGMGQGGPRGMGQGGPGGMGQGGPGGMGQGGPRGMGPPDNVNDLLQMMTQNIDQEIEHVTQRLQEIP